MICDVTCNNYHNYKLNTQTGFTYNNLKTLTFVDPMDYLKRTLNGSIIRNVRLRIWNTTNIETTHQDHIRSFL